MFMKAILSSLIWAALACGAAAAVNADEVSMKIDSMIAGAGGGTNAAIGDETFVRRAYLDIAGRIPTPAEASAFLAKTDPYKRDELVAELLESPAFVSHSFNFWADILRIKSRLPGNNGNSGIYYAAWLKDALASNMPYDVMVRELVTAQGLMAENGAVGFYLRDRGMPLDHLSTTVQVFLGTQMACAQCHDHPFDEWTQMDFYKLAAFSQQMETARLPGIGEKLREMGTDLPPNQRKEALRSVRLLTYPYQNAAIEETDRELQLPHDYKYDDAEPKDVVQPQTPFGDLVDLGAGASKSEAYANWMTSPENPRFTKVIANRLWKRAFGVGLVEPVDAFDNERGASNPELLDYLSRLMVDLDYDMRAFLAILYQTDFYGRAAAVYDFASDDSFSFSGPLLRRMTAEQVWDSLVTLRVDDPDAGLGLRDAVLEGQAAELVASFERLKEQDGETLIDHAQKLARASQKSRRETEMFRGEVDRVIGMSETGKEGAAAAADELLTKLAESMDALTETYADLAFLGENTTAIKNLNGAVVNGPRQLIKRLTNEFPELRKKAGDRTRRYAMTAGGGAMREVARERFREILEEDGAEAARKYAMQMRSMAEAAKRKGGDRRSGGGLARASELPSPAPESHFLREFGQSDRELIENANGSATVPQALSLMNGDTFKSLTMGRSALADHLEAAGGADAKIDALYLAMLSRKPSDGERAILQEEFASDPDDALESATWALLNSQQFLFVE